MMYVVLLLVLVAFTVPVSCNSTNEFTSELRPCIPTPYTSCNFSQEWKLSTELIPNQTYNFSAGNGSISIFNVQWSLAANLEHYRNFTDPQVIREDIFAPLVESVCLNAVGIARTIICQNPASLPTIRESGRYCYNPNTPASYHAYVPTGILIQLTFNLTYTVHLESGSFDFPFWCSSLAYDCEYIGEHSIPMLVDYRSMFQNWILTDTLPTIDSWLVVDPSSSRLYPYTPFPTEAFLIQRTALELFLVDYVPDCELPNDGNHVVHNVTANQFPHFIRTSLEEEYGANMTTAKLYVTPLAPLRMWIEMNDPQVFTWLELSFLIPFFNGSHFLPYPF